MTPDPTPTPPAARAFFGPWVVRATFVMAVLGWGLGFFGPSIFLHSVVQRTGWPLVWVSAAVTLHYLFGAWVVTRLPALHRRHGVGPTAVMGSAVAAAGVLGWSLASAPWQLLASALASGAGWVTMGAVAVNAAIAPWYVRRRPMALAQAYNGASIGGVVFSPLWVALISQWGFTAAAAIVGGVAVLVMGVLSVLVLSKTPERLGQCPDGDLPGQPGAGATAAAQAGLPGRLLWRDRGFRTLALGMAAGLFAQIGLLAHLFSLLVPALGAQAAGLAMGFATACAIAGRIGVARGLPARAQWRRAAVGAYAVQLAGTLVLMSSSAADTGWIWLGVALFGSGIGNATSLPPLIAQAEFAPQDVPRVVALVVALAQATYAFAPVVLGWVLSLSAAGSPRLGPDTVAFWLAVAGVQVLAMVSFLLGGRPSGGRA